MGSSLCVQAQARSAGAALARCEWAQGASPVIPTGYAADATFSRIGPSVQGGESLVNIIIMEIDGVTLSDQVWAQRIGNLFTVIDFIADPDQFVVGVSHHCHGDRNGPNANRFELHP